MRILVTGARGKVGAATIHRLLRSDHEITAVDTAPPVYERAREVRYVQADLADPGDTAAVVPGHDAVSTTRRSTQSRGCCARVWWWSGSRPTAGRGWRRGSRPATGCSRSTRCRWPGI